MNFNRKVHSTEEIYSLLQHIASVNLTSNPLPARCSAVLISSFYLYTWWEQLAFSKK